MNQKRYINLLSNLYNNLSNVYLALKKTDKATEALHKAFEIRISYADTGIIETHDMLQQMLNLVNMLILAGDLELARLVLNQYDALVTDNEGYNTLDYGCCRLASGIIALKEGKPVEAEKNLLAAESIINTASPGIWCICRCFEIYIKVKAFFISKTSSNKNSNSKKQHLLPLFFILQYFVTSLAVRNYQLKKIFQFSDSCRM